MVAVAGRDPGVYSAFVWGLPRAIEAEPDAAESLVDRLCANAPPYFFAEALLDARNDNPSYGPYAVGWPSSVMFAPVGAVMLTKLLS